MDKELMLLVFVWLVVVFGVGYLLAQIYNSVLA